MVTAQDTGLDNRLQAHFATLRSPSVGNVLRRSVGNWQVYAAVTGSVMAMATNASAGAIVYNSQSVTAGILSASVNNTAPINATNVGVDVPNRFFSIGVRQFIGGGPEQNQQNGLGIAPGRIDVFGGTAFVKGEGLFSFVHDGSSAVKKLAGGASIGPSRTFGVASTSFVAKQQPPYASGWAAGQSGFAGFKFYNSNTNTTDYGWVRLVYTVGDNQLANSITATDWAYDSSGAPITAGTESSSTPEPSTAALAFLAAGAAGIVALRRRRKSAV